MATQTKLTLQPLGDRIVVKPLVREEKTASGIFLPDAAQEKPMKGEVLAVGPGRVLDNGNVQKIEISVGDIVLYDKYAGNEVKIEGEDFLIMQERQVIGVFNK